ncbi:ABC transporter substrate-binding protein [Lusitaniella coriacea]|uniref:ABC transporter substrate-binding protein n=1 Tax=Lusitaniella coriacea TaxID=1983105 RepID=UPI003CF9DB65
MLLKIPPGFKVRRPRQFATAIACLTISLTLVGCPASKETPSGTSPKSPAQNDVLTIWWNKGYLLEEDEALRKIVRDWESKTGKKVKLSFETEDDLPQKAERALKTGKSPDILFSTRAEYELIPRLAWEGKLVDVSEVMNPVEESFSPAALQAVSLYDKTAEKRSYYAIPIYQATIYIHYWRDLVEQAGKQPSDIPQDWDGFWNFWKTIQENLPNEQNEKIHGLGITVSPKSSDTYYFFEQVLEAYSVELLDEEGQLQVDDPKVRQGIIQSLRWIAQLYKENYIPPGAVQWLNPDNNFNLLNRLTVMSPNPTLSIPAAQRQEEEIYLNKLGTLEFPNKPNGDPMRYIVSVRQAAIFSKSKNQELAKEFLAYLVRPENLDTYIKAASGRYAPITKSGWEDPFWRDRADPHIAIATKMLADRPTRPFYFALNPAYAQVLEENLWGEALNRILVENATPETAADEAIARMKEIFEEWK